MNESHAAQIRSGHKTGNITDNAAANRDHQRFAIRSGTAQRARDLLHAAQMLRRLRVAEKVDPISIRKPQATLDDFANGPPNLG